MNTCRSIAFICALRCQKNNRSLLAELRRGLSETTLPTSWSALAFIGGEIGNIVDTTIAGLFALHPAESESTNLGSTWRDLHVCKENYASLSDQRQYSSHEKRFLRLIACNTKEEVCQHLRSFILRAKSEGMGINYIALHADICRWNKSYIKMQWAKEFWSKPSPKILISSQMEVI